MTDYKLRKKFDCNQGAVRAVRYNVDGNYCLSCGSDRKVKLFNPLTGLLLKTYAGHGDEITDSTGSCDSSFILSASMDKSIIYWDVMTALPVRRIRNHLGGVTAVKFNLESNVAISGSRDNSVQMFDIRSRSVEPVQTLKEAKDCITDLIVTENKIISSSIDGYIRYYDIRAGEPNLNSFLTRKVLNIFFSGELTNDKIGIPIHALAITSDGQCLLASCQDESIRLVDQSEGDILTEYKGHKGSKDYRIECNVLKGDGYVLTGSSFGQVVIYNFLEANEVKRLNLGGKSAITSLCRHPTDDQILFACGRDVQLWSLNDDMDDD